MPTEIPIQIQELVKSLCAKAKETGGNPHFAIMLYRRAPTYNAFQSLNEFLFSYLARLDIPMLHEAGMQVGQASNNAQVEAVRPIS